MRLKPEYIQHIVDALTPFLSPGATLRLYGSRMNPKARGGDIDLLLLVPSVQQKNALQRDHHHLLAEIKKRIGDQKVDLLISEPNELEKDPFLHLVYPESQILYTW